MLKNTFLRSGLVLLFVGTFLFLFSFPSFAFSGSGSGTSGDPYMITTCAQLQEMQNALSSDYQLGNDIDCNVSPYNTGIGFAAVGNSSTNFTGTFDGAGHTISNLFINNASNSFVGLFGLANGATIKNVELKNVDITGYEYVGGLVGYESSSTFDTVSVSGSVASPGIANDSYVGGVIGYTVNGTITNAYSTATVTAARPGTSSSIAGGLVGFSQLTIKNSYATGNVTTNGSNGSAGGLIGASAANVSVMDNSFATGVVSGNDAGFLVGLCDFGSITNSYAIDAPLCGTSGSTSISADSAGGVLLSNFYQKSPLYAVYTGTPTWDFDNTWAFNDESSLPVFTWQIPPTSTPNNNSGSVSSGGGSSSAPSCGDVAPTSVPDLFQVDTNPTQAKLYFAPVANNTNGYFISYGYTPGDMRFGTEISGNSTGVMSDTLNYLSPNTTYYVRVRAGNGCATGGWSNEMKITTAKNGSTNGNRYFESFAMQVISFIDSIVNFY